MIDSLPLDTYRNALSPAGPESCGAFNLVNGLANTRASTAIPVLTVGAGNMSNFRAREENMLDST
jgi:hypothetical protein